VEVLQLFARHAAIAIDNARRYELEKRRAARFALIARVTALVNARGEMDQVLQRIADAIHESLGYQNVDIPLVEGRELVIRVRGGEYKKRIRHEDRLPLDRGIMAQAVREQRTQLVNDVANDARYVAPPGVKPPRAELAVPIVLRGQCLGVLNLESDRVFDGLDVSSMEIIASHLAVAMENIRLAEQARESAVLAERHRLARDLHDNVTQILSSMSLISQSLPQAWKRDAAEGERRALRLHELAQTGFAELRALLRELSPPERDTTTISRSGRSFLGLEHLKDGGLAAALPPLLQRMVPEPIVLHLDFQGYVMQDLKHEETVYRICQEAVSNAIKHARAKNIRVVAKVLDKSISLRISDDGVGIQSARRGGLGLNTMRERAQSIGGALRIIPAAPQGTLVDVAFPRLDRNLD
jgi:two-component system, NarL family, sensor kinase